MRKHDLSRYLDEVAARLERFPTGVQIGWVEPEGLDWNGWDCWAICHRPTKSCPVYVIGVSTALRRAPAYVLRWLILHECLHIVIKPHVGAIHTYGFRQAERSHPDYLRARSWLAAHASATTNGGRASSKA